MNKSEREVVVELMSNVEGLLQLASWQMALIRDIKNRLAELDHEGATGPPSGGKAEKKGAS